MIEKRQGSMDQIEPLPDSSESQSFSTELTNSAYQPHINSE